ncbi:unnamed protein product [Rotaria socialis]|uniref:Methyltransferase type 11 domain-containing protein n=2 Tax=Rotaria socialis TaxID=392032 RepID=A0A817LVR6_9BILA|nr:unnamed protein product [Rotaria socialis]CAF3617083.1 unnamed protein product [Rotaria socialis]CAF4195933.1 unnamed protein product [Rotaria socialis]CAF4325591.1 unnamed protein product [Rotaria socialis]
MALTYNNKNVVSTVECYDAWSNTYDSDGNVLQLLDDIVFEEIAQPRLNSIHNSNMRQICCELGCGTGRNTVKLLNAGWFVIAVDVSTCMMQKAQVRVAQLEEQHKSSVDWIIHDLNGDNELSINDSSVDTVISTLVLEHITSLEQFFKTIYRILKKNNDSWAFITTLHPNMYQAGSQASFVIDNVTGDKLYGISFDHSIQHIIEAANKTSLMLIKYFEKGVDNEEHARNLGPRAKKWIGRNIHASFLFKLRKNEI